MALAPPLSADATGGRASFAPLARTAGFLEVVAQSVAAAAPSVALASVPGAIFLVAGNGTLLSILIATVVVIPLAYTISLQARRTVSSGSLGTYTGNGLGSAAAFAAGWGLIIGYGGFATGALLGAWLYSANFLQKIGINSGSSIVGAVLVFAAFVPALVSSYRGLRLSARVSLTVEAVSLTTIGFLFIATLITRGLQFDTSQLTGKGASSSNIVLGAVLGVGAFAGFESAASLGLETKRAHHTIARVLLRAVFGLALLYVISSYIEVLGFAKLTGSSTPLQVVAQYAGVNWASYVIDVGVSVTMVAFAAAVFNAGARSLYTLSREGALPQRISSVHPRHGTPFVAVLVIGIIPAALALVFVAVGAGALRASTYTGTVSSFGFFTAYILISIATPVWLRRIKQLTSLAVLAGGGAAVALVYVFYKNLVPAPPSPYNVLPYVYAGLLLLGLAFYAVLRVRDPDRARRIGTVQDFEIEASLPGDKAEPLHAGASV
jgi:amino acid transporter